MNSAPYPEMMPRSRWKRLYTIHISILSISVSLTKMYKQLARFWTLQTSRSLFGANLKIKPKN